MGTMTLCCPLVRQGLPSVLPCNLAWGGHYVCSTDNICALWVGSIPPPAPEAGLGGQTPITVFCWQLEVDMRYNLVQSERSSEILFNGWGKRRFSLPLSPQEPGTCCLAALSGHLTPGGQSWHTENDKVKSFSKTSSSNPETS